MKILIVVLSFLDEDIYTKFFESQNKSWNSIEIDGVDTFFLVGNNDKDEIDGNLLKTNVTESIWNCGHKTLRGFELLKDYDYDYLFRTNSSSYVDKHLLKKYLSDKPKDNFYSGAIGHHSGVDFGSGCGYIISKNVVDLVLLKKEHWNHEVIDDVSLALLLNNLEIYPQPSERFDITNNDIVSIPNNYFHYRLKTNDREHDISNMYKIFKVKHNLC